MHSQNEAMTKHLEVPHMTDEQKDMLQSLIQRLKQERDELGLKIHLGQKDMQDEWNRLQARLTELNERYAPLKEAAAESAEGVWESLKLLGEEIKTGFDRIRKSL